MALSVMLFNGMEECSLMYEAPCTTYEQRLAMRNGWRLNAEDGKYICTRQNTSTEWTATPEQAWRKAWEIDNAQA